MLFAVDKSCWASGPFANCPDDLRDSGGPVLTDMKDTVPALRNVTIRWEIYIKINVINANLLI